MTDSTTYSVVLSGDIKDGFDADAVIEAFSRLFKVSPEKAGSIIGKRFVIKKEVELTVAETYLNRLDSIGLDVRLKKHDSTPALALEPLPEPPAPAPQADEAAVVAEEPLADDEMICPKCSQRQAKADECSGCGIIVARFNAAQQAAPAPVATPSAAAPADDGAATVEEIPTGVGEFKYFVFPAIAALLGALVWYGLAISLDREFGVVAWGIGGAVGGAAAYAGARGNATGVVCALLVVASILGGKYLAISSLQTMLVEQLHEATEYDGVDLRAIYEEELLDAQFYQARVEDEASLREFMVERGYTEATAAAAVSDDEIEAFVVFAQPRLEDIALNQPAFEDWRRNSLVDGINSIEDWSTYDLMIDSLGLFDLLFFFLGVGTAYRLASAGRA